MPQEREIRADYDATSIVVYQAFSAAIAEAALTSGRFVAPFSFGRMTWIKPSFLWLMERSNWGRKAGQECVLAVRITRAGWEGALSVGVLTDADSRVYSDYQEWKNHFSTAQVHVQWDPERNLRGTSLPYSSIQVGISRHLVQRYNDEWLLSLTDLTPRVRKIAVLIRSGQESKARTLLPQERLYPLTEPLRKRLGVSI